MSKIELSEILLWTLVTAPQLLLFDEHKACPYFTVCPKKKAVFVKYSDT